MRQNNCKYIELQKKCTYREILQKKYHARSEVAHHINIKGEDKSIVLTKKACRLRTLHAANNRNKVRLSLVKM
jgi:hypothetical protein